MDMFYKITNDMHVSDGWLLGILQTQDGEEADRWLFSAGKPVIWSDPLLVEVYVKGIPTDVTFNDYGTMIVSDKARKIIERLVPDAIQFFPIEAPGYGRFFVGNIVDQVDCLDEKVSHVERFLPNDPVRPDRAGEISLIIGLQIHPDKASGHHLFRLKGYDIAVIISRTMKDAFDQAGISGLRYVDVTTGQPLIPGRHFARRGAKE